jgi:hypothetical protein
MSDKIKVAQERAVEIAELQALVDREKKMTAFRNGQLNRYDAETITAEEIAKGDALKREAAEKLEKEKRELGARLRAGTI